MSISLRSCEVMQYVEYMPLSISDIVEILEEKKVLEYAIILHDKDEGVKAHYHIAMKFKSPRKSDQIAKWFNIEENFVGKVKGAWEHLLQYLTHENAPKKYQYPVEEVICNFDYNEAKIVKTGNKNYDKIRREEIIRKISCGEVREFNLHTFVDCVEYDKFKGSIENAFNYRQRILMERNDRIMECIFISGGSGSGKTTYAKMLCEKKGYSCFISGSSNDPFDGYRGEDAIILDDLRGSVFSFADLLKITDNHSSSMVKSRYKNKVLECKLLIITSVMRISEFYGNVFESSSEPLIQFERRMQTYLIMDNEKVKIFYYSKEEQSYVRFTEIANPVSEMFFNKNCDDERLEFISDMFGDYM